jgi:nucleoside-diphosphate-sugar epimerase
MITLTGSEGFIGKYVKADERIDLKTGRDICDLTALRGDVVIHLAAVSSIPKSLLDPVETNRSNIAGLIRVIQLCLKKNAHLIFASSCSVQDPRSPYAYTKLLGEYIIAVSGVSHTILRFGNVYGEGDDKSAIMHFQKNKEITIYGDGSVRRNFVCVEDIVSAIKHYVKTKQQGTFWIGHENLTIGEVASYFNKPIKYNAPKEGDAPDLWFESDFPASTRIQDWIKQNV